LVTASQSEEEMMKAKPFLSITGAIFLVLAIAGGSASLAAASPDASVTTTSLGKIVVDGKGMSAYFFDRDTANSGSSACAGQCAVIWPAITSTSEVPVVSGITGKVGTIGSTHQITINGRPIYTYLYDTALGSTNGQGVSNVWYVVSPAGNEMKSLTPGKVLKAAKTPKPKKPAKHAKLVKPKKSASPAPYSKGNY